MAYDFDITVIGAGSGGLVVASGAASLGAKVALIEREKMGGDCLNYGCVPSKSFLKGAHLAKDVATCTKYGIEATVSGVDTGKLMRRVQSVIAEIAPHDSKQRYESLGVMVIEGHAKLSGPHTVTVGEKSYSSKKIVIAAGSRAAVPPIPGLDTVDFLTNETIFDLDTTPRHLVVLGAGPIGLELGQGFRHLGAEVTIIDRGERLFSKDEPEASPLMEKVFLDDGITLKLRAQIKSVRQSGGKIAVVIEKDEVEEIVEGDRLLVSLGRVSNTADLGLETAGVQLNARGSIITNAKLQTNVKSIYACGDVCGPYQFTHTAGYQAAIVIRNALFGLNAKQNYDGIAWTTYTKPEVAHVGLLEKDAKTKGVLKKTVFVPLAENDRAKAEDDRDGFLKLIVSKTGRLIGATLIGEKAGEMIPAATLAIKRRLRVSVFLSLILSYPTEAEIFKAAALSDLKDSVAPWQTNLLRFFFRS